jgi:hypothetical protein
MMLRIALAAALAGSAIVAIPVAVRAQQAAVPASLTWFHGEWQGESDFIGRPAKASIVVQPTLNGTATSLVYTADVAASGDRPAFRFQGQGTYRIQADGRVTGVWADSYGNFHQLKGRAKNGELRVNWGDARSEVGHSSYIVSADGVLTVIDSAFVQGEVNVFGRATYRKRP